MSRLYIPEGSVGGRETFPPQTQLSSPGKAETKDL